MKEKHTWEFRPRLRSRAFGWRSSHLACQRLKEAVTEIRTVAKSDPVTAAEGVILLMERIWPAFQGVDTSSGALGSAVQWAQDELLPIVIGAPADRKTRDAWLERLWTAVQEDGVDYLSPVGERWGELCGSADVASRWADQFIGPLRENWSDRASGYFRGTFLCLSSLVAARRHEELFALLASQRFLSWHTRQFGVQVLLAEGRIDDALAFAEGSRASKYPEPEIDLECERILLNAGRHEEAYRKYAMSAAYLSSTGVAAFRAIVKKYPGVDKRRILLDLARSRGEAGRWFAAAKDCGFLDLALEFATTGRTDPRTLSRASRDFASQDPQFSYAIGRLAVERMLNGYGHEITLAEVMDAYERCLAAAERIGVAAETRSALRATALTLKKSAFREAVVRQMT